MSALSEQIRTARTEAGMTQAELGEMIGVSAQTVWRWEDGRNVPDFLTGVRLALACGVSPETLAKRSTGLYSRI